MVRKQEIRGFFSNFSTSLKSLSMKAFDLGVSWGGFSVSVETSAAGVYVSFVLSRLIAKERTVPFANVLLKTFVSARNLEKQISDLLF